MNEVKKMNEKKETEQEEEIVFQQKDFSAPEILEVNQGAYSRPGARVGFISRIDYKSPGFRAGLLKLAMRRFAEEGTHFNVLSGGLVSKRDIKEEFKKLAKNYHRKFEPDVVRHFIDQCAGDLASAIPKIKKPGGAENEYVRLYIMTSFPFDGPFGESIAAKLQELRPDDIRHYKQGGDRLEVKGVRKLIWAVNPKKSRLPSKYYSTAAEKEIDDKRGQTVQEPPNLWAVGCFASSIHKPDGERDEPYITIPALHRLEEVTVAENQVGAVVVEYNSDSIRFVRTWSFKDLVAGERKFIPVKKSRSKLQKQIIDVIKASGNQTIGLLSDNLKESREAVKKEIDGLVGPSSQIWPGLMYDSSSQRYNFNLDWLQDKLQYQQLEKDKYIQDTLLFISCPHVGHINTDYRFIVKKIPEIIYEHNVDILVAAGDLIAGLEHKVLEAGEIIGGLNNTDQEIFAAELLGTAIVRVFERRLDENLKKFAGQTIPEEDVRKLVEESLISFVYIPGNHDLWQGRGGNIPLVVFRDKLVQLLVRSFTKILVSKKLPAVDLFDIAVKKIISFADFDAAHTLPSGLILELSHPHQARADTTSLRVQHGLDRTESDCQIKAIGNFHTAIALNKWYPKRGQCLGVQIGTLLLWTPFERRKTKRVDFGAVFCRVLSANQRIEMTETAFFNASIAKKPLKKWTDLDALKRDLKIISAP